MIRDITIGQYYPTDSVIHRLDPRVKLAGTLIYVISLFTFSSFFGFLITGGFLYAVIKTAKIPLGYICKGLKSIIMIMLFAIIFNVLFSTGEHVIFNKWIFTITLEGIRKAAFMAIRLVFLILGSSLMTFTTTPNQLTDGLEKALSPLKKIKVPVHEIAMMMSIALRFIPILLEELDKIMKAQTARGADFESGNIIERAKSLIPILIPLFISAFRRANDLAMAMEARCYRGGDNRTKMKPLKYNKADKVAYGSLLIYFVATIFLSGLIII